MNNIQILHDKTRCMTINLMSSSQLDLFTKTVDLNPIFTTFKSTNRLMFYRHTLVLQMYIIIITDNRSHHDCRGVGLCLILSNLSHDGGRCSDASFFCMHQASPRSPRHLDRPSTWRIGTKRDIVLKGIVHSKPLLNISYRYLTCFGSSLV